MQEQSTNTRPTNHHSWAVSLARRLKPVRAEVIERALRAQVWVGRRGKVARLHAKEHARRWREPRRITFLIGLVAAFCFVVMVLLVYAHGLTRRAPRWWNPAITIDPAAGEAIEMGLMGHLSAVRAADPALKPGEPWRSTPWSVSLGEDDANAWLNSRMPRWMLNRGKPLVWPAEIASLQVKFEDGVIRLGVQILDGSDSVIAGVSLKPTIRTDGSLWLNSSGLDIGSLPTPAWAVGTARSAYADSIPSALRDLPETRAFFGALAGSNAIFPNATVRLDGGRRVRVLGVTPKKGRVDLTFRTEFVGAKKQ